MYRKAEVLRRIELRQSTIKDWLNCPLMYRFRHIEKLKPVYRNIAAIHGSALHLAIHLLHSKGFDQDLASLYKRALDESLKRDQDIPIKWKENQDCDLTLMRDHALELLKGYTSYKENHQCEVIYSEVEFRVMVKGYQLTGTIDQLRRNSDGDIDLVDLKSGVQRPNAKALPHDWQLSLYAYALKYGELFVNGDWVRPRIRVDRTVIYFLRAHEIYKRNTKYGKKGEQKGLPLIACQKPDWDLIQFRYDLLNIIKMITKDWPFPNPSACGFCGYHNACESRGLFYASAKLTRVKATLNEWAESPNCPQKGII
ncbi:PD-(D/E)XK nuclease family protein [bacterium]|nr:PD-(D/E)XK nuclease family protein [bacterium]